MIELVVKVVKNIFTTFFELGKYVKIQHTFFFFSIFFFFFWSMISSLFCRQYFADEKVHASMHTCIDR